MAIENCPQKLFDPLLTASYDVVALHASTGLLRSAPCPLEAAAALVRYSWRQHHAAGRVFHLQRGAQRAPAGVPAPPAKAPFSRAEGKGKRKGQRTASPTCPPQPSQVENRAFTSQAEC